MLYIHIFYNMLINPQIMNVIVCYSIFYMLFIHFKRSGLSLLYLKPNGKD